MKAPVVYYDDTPYVPPDMPGYSTNFGLQTSDYKLRAINFELQTLDHKLWTTNFGL